MVVIRESGPADVLDIVEREVRGPGHGELLVRVEAAGLNRADVLQRRGLYGAPRGFPQDVPGLEYAGVVEAAGGADPAFFSGDRVMGITSGGAMSTHVVVHEREAMRVPEGLSLVDAAAIPEVFLTVFDAFRQARVGAGDEVLVHAAGSGIGTAALQLAGLVGARAIGTSRSAAKLARCRDFGLAEGIEVTGATFADRVRELTGGRGADVVLDTVGAAYLAENVRALATNGRLVCLGLLGGQTGELPLGQLLVRRATVIGTTLRARPLEEKAALAQAFARAILPAFATGRLRPVIDAVLPMSDVREAHRRLEANETFGKLVLAW